MSGVEDVDTDELSQEDEARREGLPESGDAEEEAGELERGRKYYSLGDFIHEGAAGARRKLLMWKVRFDLERCSCHDLEHLTRGSCVSIL